MKKLILIGLVILGLTGCTVKGNPDGQIIRGMPNHNDAVLSAQNQLIIEQNKQIIEKLNQIDNQHENLIEELRRLKIDNL